MRTSFYKVFWIWQNQKEEAWINEMAEHGFGLISCGRIRFDFEDIEPGKYKYKVMFLQGTAGSEKVRDFLRFMEDMGVVNVGHVNFLGNSVIYLRYENTGEELDVYSDLDSKIEYERIMYNYLILVGILNLFASILNLGVFITSALSGIPIFGNLIIGSLCLGLTIAVAINLIKKHKKIKKYKEERLIRE